MDVLKEQIENEYRNHETLIDALSRCEAKPPANILALIKSTRRKALGRELAGALVQDPDSRTARDLLSKLQAVDDLAVECVPDASEGALDLLSPYCGEEGRITLYPLALDSKLSEGARRGNHIVVFARPNTGKTAFTLNLTRGFLRDGMRVLYLMNEEPAAQVLKRLISRITGLQGKEVDNDIPGAVARAEPLLKNLTLVDINPGTISEIRGLIKTVSPDVVVVDQMRNITLNEDNRVLALDKLAQAMRNLAKEHNVLMVTVTQAGDSARNKLVLDDGDIDFSNTGVPAAADLIVGIGVDDDHRARGRRVISIAKNKLGSDHSSFPVQIDESLAKFLSIGRS